MTGSAPTTFDCNGDVTALPGIRSSALVRLSSFSRMLLDDMQAGVWYDCYENQGSGGATLPEWFYRQQTQAMATLRPMLEAKVLVWRKVDGWPQVCKPNAELSHAANEKGSSNAS